MATINVALPANTWVEISTVSCAFQAISQREIFVVESSALPTDLSIYKTARPGVVFQYNKTDGNLYGYSPSYDGSVSYDVT